MGKILFLDVDGTIVNYRGETPPSAVKAIRKARQNGHRVYICTGRSRAEVYPELWDIGLDGMIGGNGSYVEDAGQVVMHQHITADECRAIVDWLQARGLEFYLESNAGLFASAGFATRGQPVIQEYARRKGQPDPDGMTLEKAFPDMVYGASLYRDDLNKVSYILESYRDHLDAQKAFPHMQHGTWGGAGETALFGDMGVKDVTKGHAIEALLKHLGASAADTVAFGDAKVDIPMLEACAVGVAMGNGGEEIRAMADLVTADVDDDGLAKAFETLGLA